ncbi:hypothetical protein IJG66_00915 [Candidatus Saccharibacteria bacterium]|nr:hypothetical protein [Candidatus Saccharibacteria bacterium]
MSLINRIRRGDTIVEVTFSIAIFALVAVITINLMNSGLATAQATLEVNLARDEIDSQAEALRFIHNSYLSERELSDSGSDARVYRDLWRRLTDSVGVVNGGLANEPGTISNFNVTTCDAPYDSDISNAHFIGREHAFILNTRKIDPSATGVDRTIVPYNNSVGVVFEESQLGPRIIYTRGADSTDDDLLEGDSAITTNPYNIEQPYTDLARAEGIWVLSVRSEQTDANSGKPEYFDFHIRTCWYAPGHAYPSTIATIIRLYNPELIEGDN